MSCLTHWVHVLFKSLDNNCATDHRHNRMSSVQSGTDGAYWTSPASCCCYLRLLRTRWKHPSLCAHTEIIPLNIWLAHHRSLILFYVNGFPFVMDCCYSPDKRCGIFYSAPRKSTMVSKLCVGDTCTCAEGRWYLRYTWKHKLIFMHCCKVGCNWNVLRSQVPALLLKWLSVQTCSQARAVNLPVSRSWLIMVSLLFERFVSHITGMCWSKYCTVTLSNSNYFCQFMLLRWVSQQMMASSNITLQKWPKFFK